MFSDNMTICALATGAGQGAISVIRVSGSEAARVIQDLCPGLKKVGLESHRAYFTRVKNHQGETVDEVVVTFFAEGKSFTGEASAEIGCHASPFICRSILDRLCQVGCRLADRGEFTYRAFLNDRIDLVQAEAVLGVIESQSENALKVSLRQLGGELSKQYLAIESDLLWCLAHIEASIDFSAEGIDVVNPLALIDRLDKIIILLKKMLSSYASGRLIKDGIHVSLVGQPNVGKSSLLNCFVESERAIVTDIAGTTRDVVEGSTSSNGLVFHFSDTAGLRQTTDLVETIGVRRGLERASESDVCLFVFDATVGLSSADVEQLAKVASSRILLIGNKLDLVEKSGLLERLAEIEKEGQGLLRKHDLAVPFNAIFLSALDPDARVRVLTAIASLLGVHQRAISEAVVSTARQAEMMTSALTSIQTVVTELKGGLGAEFVAQTLKRALLDIQRVLGHSYDDQIMDRVFKEFCIGK
jgi:tRNA modification GTPase